MLKDEFTIINDENKLNISDNYVFSIYGETKEILRIEQSGDIFVNGKLIENDKQVVDGFREFLRQQNLYPKE